MLRRVRRLRKITTWIALVLAGIVALRGGWHYAVRDDARALVEGRAEAELVARRNYLGSHIASAASALAPSDSQFSGEWSIVTLAMTAMAAANIGFEHSDTVPDDVALVARCAELAQKKEARAFDANRWGDDPIDAMNGPNAHAGYLAYLAIVLEAHRLLGGKDAALAKLEKDVIDALAAKLASAPTALVATYPNETYVADNAVVLAALALADVGRGARASGAALAAKAPRAALLAKTIATWRATLIDSDTHVLVFEPRSRDGGRARASGAALAAMMLAYVDDAFSKEQAEALAHFDDEVFHLFAAVCETPSCAGAGDVDSGPLVRGASPSATGFSIALAKRAGDEARLGRLLSTAEWAGITFSWSGQRRYLLAPLVGDAIVLAAKSARAWDVRYL